MQGHINVAVSILLRTPRNKYNSSFITYTNLLSNEVCINKLINLFC